MSSLGGPDEPLRNFRPPVRPPGEGRSSGWLAGWLERTYTHIYIYIYTYKRERERERERYIHTLTACWADDWPLRRAASAARAPCSTACQLAFLLCAVSLLFVMLIACMFVRCLIDYCFNQQNTCFVVLACYMLIVCTLYCLLVWQRKRHVCVVVCLACRLASLAAWLPDGLAAQW